MLSLLAGSLDQKKGRSFTLGCSTCLAAGGMGGPLPPEQVPQAVLPTVGLQTTGLTPVHVCAGADVGR